MQDVQLASSSLVRIWCQDSPCSVGSPFDCPGCPSPASRSRRSGNTPEMFKGRPKKDLQIFDLRERLWLGEFDEIVMTAVVRRPNVGVKKNVLSQDNKPIILFRPPTWSWHLKLNLRISKFWVYTPDSYLVSVRHSTSHTDQRLVIWIKYFLKEETRVECGEGGEADNSRRCGAVISSPAWL